MYVMNRTYAAVGVGEAQLPQELLLAAAAAASKRILGGRQALQTSLPAGDCVSPDYYSTMWLETILHSIKEGARMEPPFYISKRQAYGRMGIIA